MNELPLELTRRYCEPWRKYHTLHHVAKMFTDAVKYGVKLTEKQEWGIWFHDAVYLPGKDDNELESANLAALHLHRLGWAYPDINDVRDIIMSTKDHLPKNEESKLVIDLDLLVLGDETLYWENIPRLRKENRSLPERQWLEGRIAFIENYSARRTLFVSELFRDSNLNAIAKANMAEDLARLKKALAALGEEKPPA